MMDGCSVPHPFHVFCEMGGEPGIQSIFGIHVAFSIASGGGFFLRKKPLSSLASVYANSENAIAL
jgi:hypothetical protein